MFFFIQGFKRSVTTLRGGSLGYAEIVAVKVTTAHLSVVDLVYTLMSNLVYFFLTSLQLGHVYIDVGTVSHFIYCTFGSLCFSLFLCLIYDQCPFQGLQERGHNITGETIITLKVSQTLVLMLHRLLSLTFCRTFFHFFLSLSKKT